MDSSFVHAWYFAAAEATSKQMLGLVKGKIMKGGRQHREESRVSEARLLAQEERTRLKEAGLAEEVTTPHLPCHNEKCI